MFGIHGGGVFGAPAGALCCGGARPSHLPDRLPEQGRCAPGDGQHGLRGSHVSDFAAVTGMYRDRLVTSYVQMMLVETLTKDVCPKGMKDVSEIWKLTGMNFLAFK